LNNDPDFSGRFVVHSRCLFALSLLPNQGTHLKFERRNHGIATSHFLCLMDMFLQLANLPAREILDGTIRGRYAHGAAMTIGEVSLDAHAVVPMHQHPHEQMTYVIEGRFEFTVGTETKVLEPGMVVVIPGGAMHGGTTLTACKVIDVFSPVREDYR
jgi:quercetin dioxygenase-like cupin family protein